MFYCSGFLSVELQPVNEQEKRINALENNEETTSSDVLNQLAKKTPGKFVFNLVLLALIPKKVLQNAFSFFCKNINLVSPENFTHRFIVFACSWRR